MATDIVILSNNCSLIASAAESSGQDGAIYKFEKIKRAKRAAATAQPDVELLDFGVGEQR